MEIKYEVLGEITIDESAEIEFIVERLAGLEELLKITKEKSLTERIKNEIAELDAYCQKWWNEITSKYGWKEKQECHWEVDYEGKTIWIKPII